jgi:predicted nuclease of predicted toxin-antitoxin system
VKVLLDSCVWGPSAEERIAAGHDVARVGDWLADPGDNAVLAAAAVDGRVLVTLDKDFGEIAIVRGMKHAGIIRLVGISVRRQGSACRFVLGPAWRIPPTRCGRDRRTRTHPYPVTR